MDKNYILTKSNYFIMNSSYDLSLEEQKLILTLASMVQLEDKELKERFNKVENVTMSNTYDVAYLKTVK